MARMKLFGEKGFFRRAAGRNLIIVLSVLIIGAAVYLNYLYFFDSTDKIGYTDKADDTSKNVNQTVDDKDTTAAYFTSASLSRQQARDEAITVLQTVVSSADALETTKNDALAEISRIALDIERESNIETMIKAKGFTDCVTVLSEDSASVIVRQDTELLQNQIAQIKEIVYKEAGILPGNVRIIRK